MNGVIYDLIKKVGKPFWESFLASRLSRLNAFDERKIGENRLNTILEAIQARDSSVILALFSASAQREAADLPSEIETLFSFINGDVERQEFSSTHTQAQNDYGEKKIKCTYVFDVHTSTHQYVFSIVEQLADTSNAESIGLTKIVVYDITYLGTVPRYDSPGIHVYDPESTE